MVQHNQL